MTLAELNTVLAGTGLPAAYQAFPETQVPAMPFIVYQEVGSDNFGADNKVWHSAMRVQVDLFTRTKSRDTEELLETALNEASIFWEREADFEENEACYRSIYTMEI